MTSTLRKTMVFAMALAIALGCALLLAAPQHAYAKNTRLAAGTDFATANNLDLKNGSLSSSNQTAFNANYDNNFYKFTTSARAESKYKLTLRAYKNQRIFATVYDTSHHRIANVKVASKGAKSWTFKNLKPSTLYYVEVWRFITTVDGYVASGVVNDYGTEEGSSNYIQVPYKVSVKEVVTKPSISYFKATSAYDEGGNNGHHHFMKLSWTEPSFNTEGVQICFWWYSGGKKYTFYRHQTNSNKYTTWTRHWGKSYPYYIKVRPYMSVNGKRVYGAWTKAKIKNSKGKWINTTQKDKTIAKIRIK